MRTRHRWCRRWLLMVSSVVSGAIACTENYALAQSRIVPDGTLGVERSVVAPDPGGLPDEVISGGAIRGANLFHSFLEFNVSAGRGAFFFSPSAGIHNVLARVTGNNPSTILGTLGTYGKSNPNLFLINPNGIIFGPNASLSVGGSFAATTANAVQLGGTGLFSASEPSSNQLLDINPSAFLFNALSHGAIVNSSTTFGLQVPNGQSLLLLGGDVKLDGGSLAAPSGRVELGGLAGAGTVGLSQDGNSLSLSFPQGVVRADVSLTNGANVAVFASGGGSIAINARNLNISGGFGLFAGIPSGSGSVGSQSGDIEIDATDRVTLDGTGLPADRLSIISNSVDGVGTAGNIVINTGTLNLIGGNAQIISLTGGQGNAGSVTIRANTVSLSGGASALVSSTSDSSVGNAADINIYTGSLSLSNGAYISTSNFGKGNAGNIRVNATDAVSIGGNSSIATFISGQGNGGDINIQTRLLSVTNDAALLTSNIGQGNAGGIFIAANERVILDHSQTLSFTGPTTTGNGGNIQIETGSLSATNGARLSADTLGKGNGGSVTINALDAVSFDGGQDKNVFTGISSTVGAGAIGNGGDINITAGSLSLTKGAQLQNGVKANTSQLPSGHGNSGSVNVNVRDTVAIAGLDNNVSGIFTQVESGSVGNAGNINLQAESLSLTNSGVLSSSTSGQGNAGSVFVQAHDISLDNSLISSAVHEGAVGNGGDISVQARSLSLANGSKLVSAVLNTQSNLPGGQGRGGNISVSATDSVNLAGVGADGTSSGLFSSTGRGASGRAGDIAVNTGALRLTDGAVVDANTRNASDGGNITINANTLDALNGGQVLTATFDRGRAGNITINATDGVTLAGSDPTFASRLAQFGRDRITNRSAASGLFANTEANSTGGGGGVKIMTGQLQVLDGAQVAVSSQGTGNAGNLEATARLLKLDHRGQLTAETASGEGGNIMLQIGDLLLMRHNSLISTSAGTANAGGDGGNMTINTPFIVAVPQENSDITANAYTGKGGSIDITAQGIFGTQFRPHLTPLSDITASSQFGANGTVQINTPGIDPSRGISDLPTQPADASRQIAQNCATSGSQAARESEFVVTGRGGLPPTPRETLSDDAVLEDWGTRALAASSSQVRTSSVKRSYPARNRLPDSTTAIVATVPTNPPPVLFVEAQGWMYGPHGEVILTASPTTTSRSPEMVTSCNRN